MAAPRQETEVVRIQRTFPAPREKVFEAWTNPALMARWFGRGNEKQQLTRVTTLDLRPGGSYRAELTDPSGKLWKLRGVYEEVQPPDRLVFTWQFEGEADFPESRVTVNFRRLGQSDFTEVELLHERLTEKWREDHRKGWTACFEMLEKTLSGK